MHSPAKAPPNRLLTAVLCLSGVVVALQHTLVVPLLGEFPEILGVDYPSASWLVTITLLCAAVATPILSRLADMFGKRLMMLVSLGTIVAGSLIAALGGTFLAVLVGRGLQGLASALVPIGIAMLRDELPRAKVAGATALMSATLGIGGALGLPLPGVLYEHLGWQSIFWLSAIAAALLFAAVLAVVPESAVRTRGRFDFGGAVLLSIALVALLLVISKGGSWGWTSGYTLGAAAVAVLGFAVWFPFELRVSLPMVDLRTSARRPVLLTNVAALLCGVSMYANMLATIQELTMPVGTGYGFGLSVLAAGLCMMPAGLVMVVFAPISARLIRRIGAKYTLMTGTTILAVAYLVRVLLNGSVPLVIGGAMFVMVGTAIAYAAMPMLIMGSVPITETASANGLNTLLRSVGTAISSALISALLTTITLEVGGERLPAFAAFQLVFVIAAVAAAVATAVAFFIPRIELPAEPVPDDGELPDELVVTGTVRGGGEPIRHAVVTVLRTTGEPADWGRADNAGEFTVVLPAPGPYLVITGADGWAPESQVMELAADSERPSVVLTRRLSLRGRVTAAGEPCAGAMISLVKASGEYVAATVTGSDGGYELAQPPSGRYLVTVLAADRRTATRHVAVLTRPAEVDFELDHALQGAR
ncbi:MFS transporter [Nocardia asteroides]|uniref:MFS transporter n=1 Tax=Nocardia asteroides TaxID=1824 RepID=UPI001E3CE094|nr:MFS transporter [Nocardia asteroides]UGT61726.1 MFS transporter [Nocardia asteroides]